MSRLRCLFATDHRFSLDSNGIVWSPGRMPYAVWQRYLAHFECLTIMGRRSHILPRGAVTHSESSGERVRFELLPSLSSATAAVLKYRSVEQRAARLIADHDVVVARVPSMFGFMAARLARVQRKPYALEVTGCPFDGLWNHGAPLGKLYAPFMATRLKQETRSARFLVYVTEAFLQARYPAARDAKILIASNVELPCPDPRVLERRLVRIAGDSETFTLGMIGTVGNAIKGHTTVLAALANVGKMFPGLALKVLGDGNPIRLEQQAKKLGVLDRVQFCGTLAGGEAVLAWLDNVDLYLQPSFREGLPRALIEAMSRGCPALGSTAGGISELLPGEMLHKPGDFITLARQLECYIPDQGWRERAAVRNFNVASHYAKPALDARRALFWERFVDDAQMRLRRISA